MTMHTFLALFAAVLGGACVAMQAPLNAALASGLKSTMAAAAVSFGVGFVVLMVLVWLIGDSAALGRIGSVNPVLLAGGLLGAVYVFSIVWAVPTLGVVTAISALILGQLAVALVLDAVGPFGFQAIAITWQRVAGIALVIAGLVLSKA